MKKLIALAIMLILALCPAVVLAAGNAQWPEAFGTPGAYIYGAANSAGYLVELNHSHLAIVKPES